jgi:hypothetical protein
MPSSALQKSVPATLAISFEKDPDGCSSGGRTRTYDTRIMIPLL